ncbi:MAG: YggT family protein [bacterium]|nr:YggT family protein [bacterium]
MFLLGRLLNPVASLLDWTLQLAILLFIARAVLSWMQPDPRQPVISTIYRMTDPILDRVRRVLPSFGAVDLSPMIVIIALWFLKSFLVPSLHDIASRMLQ